MRTVVDIFSDQIHLPRLGSSQSCAPKIRPGLPLSFAYTTTHVGTDTDTFSIATEKPAFWSSIVRVLPANAATRTVFSVVLVFETLPAADLAVDIAATEDLASEARRVLHPQASNTPIIMPPAKKAAYVGTFVCNCNIGCLDSFSDIQNKVR